MGRGKERPPCDLGSELLLLLRGRARVVRGKEYHGKWEGEKRRKSDSEWSLLCLVNHGLDYAR